MVILYIEKDTQIILYSSVLFIRGEKKGHLGEIKIMGFARFTQFLSPVFGGFNEILGLGLNIVFI